MVAIPDRVLAACRPYFRESVGNFVVHKEFGYSWKVYGGRIEIGISDYLDEAPDQVLCDFCDMICRKARGQRCQEPESYLDHVRSDSFIVEHRPVYISRSRNLTRTANGDVAYLYDSVQRLVDSGLLTDSDIENSYISWTRRDNVRRVGFCSTMFRVVGISSRLDSDDIPDHVRDYVVYHECLHLRQGYRPSHRVHDAEFRSWELSFPGWRESETILRKLGSM